eukprot:RCo025132
MFSPIFFLAQLLLAKNVGGCAEVPLEFSVSSTSAGLTFGNLYRGQFSAANQLILASPSGNADSFVACADFNLSRCRAVDKVNVRGQGSVVVKVTGQNRELKETISLHPSECISVTGTGAQHLSLCGLAEFGTVLEGFWACASKGAGVPPARGKLVPTQNDGKWPPEEGLLEHCDLMPAIVECVIVGFMLGSLGTAFLLMWRSAHRDSLNGIPFASQTRAAGALSSLTTQTAGLHAVRDR